MVCNGLACRVGFYVLVMIYAALANKGNKVTDTTWEQITKMSREELLDYIKQLNGLLGAVDGDTIKAIKKMLEICNVTAWQVKKYLERINYLVERAETHDKAFVIKGLNRIQGKVRKISKEVNHVRKNNNRRNSE